MTRGVTHTHASLPFEAAFAFQMAQIRGGGCECWVSSQRPVALTLDEAQVLNAKLDGCPRRWCGGGYPALSAMGGQEAIQACAP